MLNQLLDFIEKQKLFQPGERILLAVSGGIDSVVMLHLFQQAGFHFGVAHCNFMLRGAESDGDEAFVKGMTAQFEAPFFVRSFQTETYAKEQGISIQMAARDLRRAWFEALLKQEGYDKIATAHHLNDSLETVLFNLAKGTGIEGLRGIVPYKGHYIRPLLFATREMIRQYAAKHNIEWREDRSNSSVKYSRNLIRHKVVPALKKINPSLENTFAQTMEKIGGAAWIYNNYVGKEKSRLLQRKQSHIELDKSQISSLGNPPLVLFEALEEFGFNYAQVKDVVRAMDSQSGKIFHSDSHQLTIDREKLFLERRGKAESGPWKVDESTSRILAGAQELKFEILKAAVASIEKDRNVAMLDKDLLQFPLILRNWRPGDVFFPLGMKHKKKVSDFMIDEKIPVNLKKQTLVLLSGDALVWVVGHRIDDRFKITKKTSNIFRIYKEVQ